MRKQPGFMLYRESSALFEQLTDEQAGRVIKAALLYFGTGEIPQSLEQIEMIVFTIIKGDIERSVKRYVEIQERNRKNGEKGGRPPKEEN